jgi:hypothetical protein
VTAFFVATPSLFLGFLGEEPCPDDAVAKAALQQEAIGWGICEDEWEANIHEIGLGKGTLRQLSGTDLLLQPRVR